MSVERHPPAPPACRLLARPLAVLVAAVGLLAGPLPGGSQAAGPEDAARPELAAEINRRVADNYPALEALYKHLHSHPELSLQEEQTAARLVRELEGTGFEVTTGVGGHGVVAVLKNGAGPTVLVRTDMDALPVVEQTGLPYASKVRARDRTGQDVGVMHACGHDMHIFFTN
jgi:hippurate hydrolase